ncbi:MAG TPA: hypothetical protein VGG75_28145 [Trebonia sp.]|jgi:hypothetical protein
MQPLFTLESPARYPGPGPARAPRSDRGTIRISARDLRGLTLTAEMYAAPYDLLAAYLGVSEPRLRAILSRWRRAGLVQTGRLAEGPSWAWVTQAGMRALGFPWQAAPPPLARLAHNRAVLACRLWLETGDAYRERGARWRPERALRAEAPAAGRAHVADAEITWPPDSGSDGEVWGVEVELSAKGNGRLDAILAGLLARPYARIAYLCSPQARPVVARAAARLDGRAAARLSIRDVPPAAFMPGGGHVAR